MRKTVAVAHPAAVKAHNRAKEARPRAVEARNGALKVSRLVSYQFYLHQYEEKHGSASK